MKGMSEKGKGFEQVKTEKVKVEGNEFATLQHHYWRSRG